MCDGTLYSLAALSIVSDTLGHLGAKLKAERQTHPILPPRRRILISPEYAAFAASLCAELVSLRTYDPHNRKDKNWLMGEGELLCPTADIDVARLVCFLETV